MTKLPGVGILRAHERGGCSSMVEHQIVVLVVAGSSPVIHPRAAGSGNAQAFLVRSIRSCLTYVVPSRRAPRRAPVAQLDRASDFESAGRRFESCRAYENRGPLAQLVEQQTLNLRVRGSIPLRLTYGTPSQRPARRRSARHAAGAACQLLTHYASSYRIRARVVELVDTPDLGSGTFGCKGSSPFSRNTTPTDARASQSRSEVLRPVYRAGVAQG